MYQLMNKSGTSEHKNIELSEKRVNPNTPQINNTPYDQQQNTSSPNDYNSPMIISDHLSPLEAVDSAIEIGYMKAISTSYKSLQSISSSPSPFFLIFKVFLKSILSGSYLGFAISITIKATGDDVGWDKVSGALLFPFGFLLLILSGNSLATGNFALLPMAYLFSKKRIDIDNKKKVTICMVLTNWLVVYVGNFVGCLLCLFLLWGGMTHFGHADESNYIYFKESLCSVAEHKILTYSETGGASGWFASLFNGMLANWLVTLAVLLSIGSKTTIGKVISVYLPISIFVALGFEHAIVNLFVLPGGLVYKCDSYNFGDWWLWNQIPVTLGNIIGGATLTGFMYYAIYEHKL